MKQLLSVLLVLVLIVPASYAQVKVQAGANTEYDNSLQGGVSYEFNVAFLRVEPGAIYATRKLDSETTVGHFEMPVTVRWNPVNVGPLGAYLLGGGVVGILFKGSNDVFEFTSAGYRVGAGVKAFGFEVEGYYGKAVTDILKSEDQAVKPEDFVVTAGYRFQL